MRFSIGIAIVVLAACGDRPKQSPDGGGGSDGTTDDGQQPPPNDGQGCGTLTATVRDFQAAHPDFEDFLGDDLGIVAVDLGADNKPVYASAGTTPTTTGKTNFDQWYRDVAGVNMSLQVPLVLTEAPQGTFTFEDADFFPLDNLGFGNEGNAHNFHFTTEIHGTFTYRGGEIFQFIGDDDVWVFVNKKLGIDLGGVHGAENKTLDFDAQAGALGITVGSTYQLDVFHAERHTVESNFKMVTTIECFIIQ